MFVKNLKGKIDTYFTKKLLPKISACQPVSPDTINEIYELICVFPFLTASSREGYEIPGEGYEILSIWG